MSDAQSDAEDEMDDGPPPPPLTTEQGDELLAAIAEMRKSSKTLKREVHGWALTWTTRGKAGAKVRGDLLAIDPRDGQKLFSSASIERKLMRREDVAVEEAKPQVEASSSAAEKARVPRAVAALMSSETFNAAPSGEGDEGGECGEGGKGGEAGGQREGDGPQGAHPQAARAEAHWTCS